MNYPEFFFAHQSAPYGMFFTLTLFSRTGDIQVLGNCNILTSVNFSGCNGAEYPDGSGERLITSAYHVEGPSWSPNGRVLTYFKERPQGDNRIAKLYTIDLTGYNERLLQTPLDGSDPAWSPINKQ